MHRVDRVLAGGLHTGELTEIFGASGSGKTQLCMAIAAHAASVKMARVLYVDTCSGFSAQRTQSILLGDWDVQATSDALKRIEVVRTGDVAQVLALIDRIDASAPSPKEQNLVIIDSLGFLLLPLMHSGDYAGFAMQTTLLAQKLKHLAVSHDLAVLVTNYSTTPQQDATSTASAVAPARAGLGSAWSFAPSVQISTVETDLEEGAIKELSLRRSTRSRVGARQRFMITESGPLLWEEDTAAA